MKRFFVAMSKIGMNGLYRLFCTLYKRSNTVLFLSRQSEVPSYDYTQLAKQVESHGWQAINHLIRVRSKENSGSSDAGVSMAVYARHVFKQLQLLAQCRMIVLDRYDPVIGLLNFTEEPCIVQLWHAFGAYKKFGHQSIGTLEGHKQETIDTFSIHRNYSWVACSGEGARSAFSEALNTPLEHVIAFNRPEYFELLELRNNIQGDDEKPTILLAPTLRKSNNSPHPFRDLYLRRTQLEELLEAPMEWSFHPLEEGLPAPGNANELLMQASLVITDYSSIVYEAYLLNKPVIFYIPDIETYLKSPGLNINPAECCPELCAYTEDQLVTLVNKVLEDPDSYREKLIPFAQPAFEGATNAPSDLIETFFERDRTNE